MSLRQAAQSREWLRYMHKEKEDYTLPTHLREGNLSLAREKGGADAARLKERWQ